jgi:uncharacterized protein (UPF0332 family)
MTGDKDKHTLVQYRMAQAQSALKEAQILREKSDSTLGAANRAYYAMFYAVLALLQMMEKVPRKHSGAIALFDGEFVRKGIFPRELSGFLHQAFASRQDSDYQTIEPISFEQTDELIRNASDFVQTVEAYLKRCPGGNPF